MKQRPANPERASCTYFERKLRARFEAAIVLVSAVSAAASSGCHADNDPPADASVDASEVAAFCTSVTIDGASIEPDAEAGCAQFRTLPCGLSPDASLRGCYLDLDSCRDHCDLTGLFYCQLPPTICDGGAIRDDVPMLIECNTCAIGGRRPMGLVPAKYENTPSGSHDAATGAYLASMAHLEASSVRAFIDLATWLDALGAPTLLKEQALRSAQDERRHARVTTRLARRFGAKRPRARARRTSQPTLHALLEDNIVEGCVRETFGALLVYFQAGQARDPEMRRAFARIAVDEARHAALAWATLAWGIRHSDVTSLRQLRFKMESALASLLRSASIPVAPTTREMTGHPTPRVAKLLVAHVRAFVRAEAKTLL